MTSDGCRWPRGPSSSLPFMQNESLRKSLVSKGVLAFGWRATSVQARPLLAPFDVCRNTATLSVLKDEPTLCGHRQSAKIDPKGTIRKTAAGL